MILWQTNRQMDRQELRFLWSAHCLMVLYIYMKFHENVLNGFRVIDRTQNDQCQFSKGTNSKNVLKTSYGSCDLHVIWWCFIFLLSFMILSCLIFKLHDFVTDRQMNGWTDRQPGQKQYVSPAFSRGDIIKAFLLYPYLLQGQQAFLNCKPLSVGCPGDLRYTTPLPHPTTPK